MKKIVCLGLFWVIVGQSLAQRPQEPKPPYPYYEEEVKFDNPSATGVTLSGTLTLPDKEGVFPAVILISGSGAQNRDEELFGHKPFWVLADYFARRGIAVLRYDDRGVFGSTGENIDECTSFDFSTDAEVALQYLLSRSEINPRKIGFAGHSEGATIAAMVASRNPRTAFVVMLAGCGLRGDSVLYLQNKLLMDATPMLTKNMKEELLSFKSELFKMVAAAKDIDQLEDDLTDYLERMADEKPLLTSGLSKEKFIDVYKEALLHPWMLYFIQFDPAETLKKITCPVLALGGGRDLQVSAQENIAAIKSLLSDGGNKRITVKIFPELNHLFQTCTTGAVEEYKQIQETFSPKAMKFIANWINITIKN